MCISERQPKRIHDAHARLLIALTMYLVMQQGNKNLVEAMQVSTQQFTSCSLPDSSECTCLIVMHRFCNVWYPDPLLLQATKYR